MKHIPALIMLMAIASPLPLIASESEATGHHSNDQMANQEYAGLDTREIGALSDQEMDDLRAGRGMGFALPAELNGYPGPRHVLDLADRLNLDESQFKRTQAMFEEMQREAIAAGERYIARERKVDAVFSDGESSAEDVDAATRAAALAQGELRAIHLRYHLEMKALLTDHQIHRYQQMRGYEGGSGARHHGH